MVRNLQEQNVNYACTEDAHCKMPCKRKRIWAKSAWFDKWIEGKPEDGTNCPYLVRPLTNGIFINKLFGDDE